MGGGGGGRGGGSEGRICVLNSEKVEFLILSCHTWESEIDNILTQTHTGYNEKNNIMTTSYTDFLHTIINVYISILVLFFFLCLGVSFFILHIFFLSKFTTYLPN